MHTSLHYFRPLALAVAVQAALASPAFATDVVISSDTDATQAFTTGTNSLTVDSGATLTVSSGTTATVSQSGTGTLTITNNGTMTQTGGGRVVNVASNGNPVTIINNAAGALMKATGGPSSEVIRVDDTSGTFTINNEGTIWQAGTDASDSSRAIKVDKNYSTGFGGTINNGSAIGSSALIQADSNDAMRIGSNVTLNNYGTIISRSPVNTSCPDYAGSCAQDYSAGDGVAVESGRSNVTINNWGTIVGPRHGIDIGEKSSASANEETTVTNYATGVIIGQNGSGIGSDGDGTVVNYGLISGRYAGAGNVFDQGAASGASTTSNGDGDGVDIDGVATITNYGRIEALGAGGFDSGGNPNGADGIAAGGGLIVNHAGAMIYGYSKGILVDDGANGTVTGRGTAEANGDVVSITNDGTIIGDKKTAIGLVGNYADSIINGATGVIIGGAGSVRVDEVNSTTAAAAIQMGEGNDTLTNSGYIEGKNGLAIDMGNGDDVTNLYAGGSTGVVVGSIDGGAGSDTLVTRGTHVFASGAVLNFENYTVETGSTTFSSDLGTATDVVVDSGASLQINGGVTVNDDLTVNGTFKTSTLDSLRTINIGGDYAQGASGVLETAVGADNLSDVFAVTGTATLTSGATIRPISKAYVAGGSVYSVISAGTLTATPADLVLNENSALVDYALGVTGNNLQITATRVATYEQVVGEQMRSLAAALTALGESGSSAQDALLGALDNLSSTEAVNEALEQVAPVANGSSLATAMTSQGLVLDAFESRMDAARSQALVGATATGLAAGDADGQRFWVQVLASQANQGAREGQSGFKAGAQGFALGFESDLNASELAGVSVGYTTVDTDNTGAAAGDAALSKAFNVGAYYSRSMVERSFDASVLLSVGDINTLRLVEFPGFSESATGDTDSYQLAGRVEWGFPFAMSAASWSGRWLAGARMAYVQQSAYTETGSSAALSYDAQDAFSAQSVLGVELVRKNSETSSYLIRARYLHEFADAPEVTAAFVTGGSSFTVANIEPARDALQLGFGLRHVTEHGTVVNIAYDSELKDKFVSHQLSLKAMWGF